MTGCCNLDRLHGSGIQCVNYCTNNLYHEDGMCWLHRVSCQPNPTPYRVSYLPGANLVPSFTLSNAKLRPRHKCLEATAYSLLSPGLSIASSIPRQCTNTFSRKLISITYVYPCPTHSRRQISCQTYIKRMKNDFHLSFPHF